MTTEQRLRRLEDVAARERRLNRWLLALLGLCLAGWVGSAALRPRTATAAAPAPDRARQIEAEEFGLVDGKGTVRAYLTVTSDGPALWLADAKQKIRGIFHLDTGDAPTLSLADTTGRRRASLSLHVPTGEPCLSLSDAEGKPRAALRVADGIGETYLLLSDAEQKAQVCLSLDARSQSSGLSLRDAAGRERLALGLRKGRPVLVMYDADGNVAWRAP